MGLEKVVSLIKKPKEEAKELYIVTNCTMTGNYTPSLFNTLEDAKQWMYECTALNLNEYEDIPEGLSYKEMCEWCKNNNTDLLTDFDMYEDMTSIYYPDTNYNIMQIFKATRKVY